MISISKLIERCTTQDIRKYDSIRCGEYLSASKDVCGDLSALDRPKQNTNGCILKCPNNTAKWYVVFFTDGTIVVCDTNLATLPLRIQSKIHDGINRFATFKLSLFGYKIYHSKLVITRLAHSNYHVDTYGSANSIMGALYQYKNYVAGTTPNTVNNLLFEQTH